MRDIIFRGMDIHGRWFYGNLAVLTRDVSQGPKKGHYISNSVGMPFAYQVRPETVSQFTGTYDLNGKEIYEKDRFRSNYSAGKSIGTIKYIVDGFKIVWDEPNYGRLNDILRIHAKHGEVIGNIFED